MNVPASQAQRELSTIPFDPELTARSAQCGQRVPPHPAQRESHGDHRRGDAGDRRRLVRELETAGRCPITRFVLEDLAPRPLTDLPREILDDMETSEVSIFAVQAQANELRSRMQMTDVVNRRKMRHAHMVNINRRIMLEGMRADFLKVDRISTQGCRNGAARRSRSAPRIPPAPILTADLNPDYQWLKTSGIISPDKWGNLPGGEIFTTPGEVNGTFVIDGVVGDYLCEKFGDLRENPLTIRGKGQPPDAKPTPPTRNWKTSSGATRHTDENSDRVGEFAIGTNIALNDVIGKILQDEKYPGMHIAFGNPYGAHTGADWYSSTHIDVVGRNFDIWVDGRRSCGTGSFCWKRMHLRTHRVRV